MGTVLVTLSPESITTPVVLPLEYRARTAFILFNWNLDCQVELRHIEFLEHYLCDFLSV